MTAMLALFCLFFGVAATPMPERATRDISVREDATPDAATLFTIESGQRYWRMDADRPWTRIKVRVLGQWQAGYINLEDLDLPAEKARGFALGVGVNLSQLTQAPRTFQTSDSVSYQMTSLKSSTLFPFMLAQWGEFNFWRLRLGVRQTAYTGQAKSVIQGSRPQNVELNHAMVAFAAERAWSPAFARWPGGGMFASFFLELAQAYAVRVQYAGQTLATNSQNLATYTGLGLALGAQHRLGENFALSAEARYGDEVNQAPSIYNLEIGLQIIRWF